MQYDDRLSMADLLLAERGISAICTLGDWHQFPSAAAVRPFFRGTYNAITEFRGLYGVSGCCLFNDLQVIVVLGGLNTYLPISLTVAAGFRNAVFSEVDPVGSIEPAGTFGRVIYEACEDAGADLQSLPVTIIGHSYGGVVGVALLAVIRSQPRISTPPARRVITLGTPKVGNDTYVRTTLRGADVLAIRIDHDFVPRIPPAFGDVEDPLADPFNPFFFAGAYQPIGRGVVLHPESTITSASNTATLSNAEFRLLRDFVQVGGSRAYIQRWHSPERYRDILRSILARRETEAVPDVIRLAPGAVDEKPDEELTQGGVVTLSELAEEALAAARRRALKAVELSLPAGEQLNPGLFPDQIPANPPGATQPAAPDPGRAVDPRVPAGATPRITRIAPASGPRSGGTTLVIHGVALRSVTRVWIGTVQAPFVRAINDELLLATAPAHVAGTVHVRLDWIGGTTKRSSSAQYQYTERDRFVEPPSRPLR